MWNSCGGLGSPLLWEPTLLSISALLKPPLPTLLPAPTRCTGHSHARTTCSSQFSILLRYVICMHAFVYSFYPSPCSAKGFCSLRRRKWKALTGHHIQLCRVFTAQEHHLREQTGAQMQSLSFTQACSSAQTTPAQRGLLFLACPASAMGPSEH